MEEKNNSVSFNDELLDVVDKDNKVIGQEWRSVIWKEGRQNEVRAVWLFLKNKEGKLWIPRRAKNKKILPNALDGSVAGCVSAGETYEQAVEREALEEIGIDIKGKYRFLGYCNPVENDTICHVHAYEMDYDEIPPYDETEFSESLWLSPEEVIQRVEKGESAKPSLPCLIKRFFIKERP